MAFTDNFGKPNGFIGCMMLWGMNMGHSPLSKWGFTLFDIPQEGRIVDIGCGGGYNVRNLIKKSALGRVYGVDISEASVNISKLFNRKYLGKRCEIFQAGAECLPFKDNTIDLVTAFETVYFWPGLPKCFQEVYRVLKPGGIFLICNESNGDTDKDEKWTELIGGMTIYRDVELKAAMQEAGFMNIQIHKNPKDWLCVIGRKQEK